MKTKCPNCGHEFETFDLSSGFINHNIQSSYLNPLNFYKEKYPNKEIPPYPYGICGDMMAVIIECKVCDKLFWTAHYSFYRSGLCHECSLKEANK